ncbi:MAG: choline-sulfatase, partial [Pseudomonadota bacterium]
MTSPNIVVIMADQLAPQFTGAYGHPMVKTPHLDALAARGMRFDAAYCNAPLCAPSRFSFMSGQHVTRIAAYDNASEFPASIPTFAHYLRRAGYRTCLSGKMHFVGPDQLHGFEERLTTDVYPADHAWTPDWELPDERIDSFYHNMDAVTNAGVAATTFQIEYDEETAFFARRRIFEYRMEKVAPFCMVVSFIHPHDPYVARPEWWNLYDHDAIEMPANTEATDPHSLRIMRGIEADVNAPTEAQIRNARHAYFANISYFDAKVGAVVQALEESDQLDDTVIIVTADHGDMLGDRGLWYKMTFFEHSARVPL